MAAKATGELHIAKIGTETMLVPIVGTSPLIVHNFSEKARRQMLEGQTGNRTRSGPKKARDPEAEYQLGFYRTKDAYGFPVTAFKKATVGAARFWGTAVKMTELKMCIFMRGLVSENDPLPLVEIAGVPRMREDVVRLSGRTAYVRFRPEFPEWSAVLDVTFVRSSLSRESVLSLIDAGGMGIGVGEWRPERGGEFGTYMIDPAREVEVVRR